MIWRFSRTARSGGSFGISVNTDKKRLTEGLLYFCSTLPFLSWQVTDLSLSVVDSQ